MNINERNLESAIKTTVINHLMYKKNGLSSSTNAFIINEFSIANFTRRVDLIQAKKNQLFAFEIKSESDSLYRLKGQVDEYLEHFDKVTVVAAPKHVARVLELTPKNVAVWEITGGDLKIIRRGNILKINNKYKFLRMMTLNELSVFAKKMGVDVKEKRRKNIELSLLNISSLKIRNEAIVNIRARYKKRGKNIFEELKRPLIEFKSNDDLTYKNNEKKTILKESPNIKCFIRALESM